MRHVIAIGGAALLLAGAGNAATGPSLRLASTKPFVVKGAHFKRGERVLVTLRVDGHRWKRAGRVVAGGFSVSFGSVGIDRCSSFLVRANGSAGDSASLRHLPLPECLPATSP